MKLNTTQLRVALNMLENKAQELTEKVTAAMKAREAQGMKLLRQYTIEEIQKHGAKVIHVAETHWCSNTPTIELVKASQDRIRQRVQQELAIMYPQAQSGIERVKFVSMKRVEFYVPKAYVKAFASVDRKLTRAILDGSAFEVTEMILGIGEK